jgi:hypothetical protein
VCGGITWLRCRCVNAQLANLFDDAPWAARILPRFKGPLLLDAWLRVGHPVLHAYVLRLYRAQFRFLPKKWRIGLTSVLSEVWAANQPVEWRNEWLAPPPPPLTLASGPAASFAAASATPAMAAHDTHVKRWNATKSEMAQQCRVYNLRQQSSSCVDGSAAMESDEAWVAAQVALTLARAADQPDVRKFCAQYQAGDPWTEYQPITMEWIPSV